MQDFHTIESLKAELAQALDEKKRLLEIISALPRSDSTVPLVTSLVHEIMQPLAATRINIYALTKTPLPDRTGQSFGEVLRRIDSDTERAIDLVNRLRELFNESTR